MSCTCTYSCIFDCVFLMVGNFNVLIFLGCKGKVVSDIVGGFKHPGVTGGS